jgi:hypothetical protein
MRYLVSISLLALVACGGSSNNSGGTTTDTVAQLTIKNTGITTQTGGGATFSVPNPGAVIFINSDTAPHSIASSSPGCGQLSTGNLAAGASSSQLTLSNTTSANLVCAFNDTLNPANTAFQGQVTILTSGAGTGSGY